MRKIPELIKKWSNYFYFSNIKTIPQYITSKKNKYSEIIFGKIYK
jgi:hypothetical protein